MEKACVDTSWNRLRENVFLFGDQMKKIQGHVYKAFQTVGGSVRSVNDATTKVISNSVALRHLARCSAYAIAAGELAKGCTEESSESIIESLHSFSSFINATRVFDNTNYFLSGAWKKDNAENRHSKIVGKALLVVGGAAGTTKWLAQAGAINLGELAHSIGRIKVFSFVGDIASLGKFSMSVAGVGLTFLAIDAMKQLVEGHNIVQSWCDLAHRVAEVVFIVFLLVGCACPVAHVILGLTAAGTGIASHLHKEYRSNL